MTFGRTLKSIGFLTLMALIYISMQMQILSLAYEGKAQEKKIQQLIENNSNVTYEIMVMKSANHIGSQLLAADPSLDFADETAVIEIAAPIVEQYEVEEGAAVNKEETLFSRLLSFASSEAQARVLE